MQEDASTCEMQQETHGTAAFRVQRASGSGQPAACAKRCTRQPVRIMAQTPYTRCIIRPGPQHAATHMKVHGGKRTKSGSSRTSGLRRARWLRCTLGVGLTARLVRRLLLCQAVRADCGEPMHAPSLRRLPPVSLASVSLSVHPALALRVWDIGFRGVGAPYVPECPVLRVARLDCDSHSPAVRVQHSIRLHHRRRPSVPRGARVSGFRSPHHVHCIACCELSVPFVLVACCGTGRMVVCCILCGVCAVLRTGCRVQFYAHTAGCPLPASRCSPHTKCGSAVCFLLHLACARVLLHAACRLMHIVCCNAVRCPVSAAGRMLP